MSGGAYAHPGRATRLRAKSVLRMSKINDATGDFALRRRVSQHDRTKCLGCM